jgi:aminodeoxyfutalosine synthase
MEKKWSRKEIKELFEKDLHDLGLIVNSGRTATFVVNRHINYTNVCVSRCPLCAFYRNAEDNEAYLMSIDDILMKVKEASFAGATELHIVGSHNPDVTIEYFEEMFMHIKSKFPDMVLKALTATEIHFISKLEKCSIKEVLSRLKDAGLQVIPGGGAEILDDEIRKIICPNKAYSDEWLNIMRTAHELGIKSNATMLFGHIEEIRHRALHLYKLWKLQNETAGFLGFVPLVFHPGNTELREKGFVTEKTNPVDILKTIAVSRIVLNNFKGIRAYWVMLGEDVAQIALNYGANDMDGTLMGESISHSAGAKTPVELARERIVDIIQKAGMIPAERDTFYNILKE